MAQVYNPNEESRAILAKYGISEGRDAGQSTERRANEERERQAGAGAYNENDRSRRILAKYGLADYTDEEKNELAGWQERINGSLDWYDNAWNQLGKNGWNAWQGDADYRTRLDEQIQDMHSYLDGIKTGDVSYEYAWNYLQSLERMQNQYQKRADFYGQFQNADEYGYYQDLGRSWERAKALGMSREEWASEIESGSRDAAERADDLRAEIASLEVNIPQTEEELKYYPDHDPLFDSYLEQSKARLEEARQELEIAEIQAARGAYQAPLAHSWRYADLPGTENFRSDAEAGRTAYESYAAEQDDSSPGAAETYMIASAFSGGNPTGAALATAAQLEYRDRSYYEPNDNWSDQEKNTFYWLYQNRGLGSAIEYGAEVNTAINTGRQRQQAEALEEWANQNGWTRAAAWGLNILAAPIHAAEYADKLVKTQAHGVYVPSEQMMPGTAANNMVAAASRYLNEQYGTISEDIPVIGGKGWGDAYQLTNSIAKSMIVAKMGGGAANALFFGEAANMGFDEAKLRGASDEQALIMGFLNGSAEVLGETFSIERLVHMKSPGTIRRFLLETLKQGGVEASEEAFTTLLNTFADAIVMGDKSELNTKIRMYQEQGLSEEEAQKQAWLDWCNDIAADALGGFLSGGVSGGLQQGTNIFLGTQSEYTGDQQALLELARSQGQDSRAYRLAQEIDGKGWMSQQDALRLEGSLSEDVVQHFHEQQAERERTGWQQQAQERLETLGLSREQIAPAAEAISRELTGEKVERGQRKAHQAALESAEARQTLSELREVQRQQQLSEAVQRAVRAQERREQRRGKSKTESKADEMQPSAAEGSANLDSSVKHEGRETQIRGLTRTESGELRVQVQNEQGETVSVKPEELDYGESGLGELVKELGNRPDAPAMFAAYFSGQDIGDFVNGWNVAKMLGQRSSTATVESVMRAGGALLEDLDPKQVEAAFNYGRSLARQEQEQRAKEKKTDSHANAAALARNDSEGGKRIAAASERTGLAMTEKTGAGRGGVSFEGGTVDGVKLKAVNRARLTDKQRTQIEAVQMLSKATGIRFVFYESEAGKGGRLQGSNGLYKDGVIYLDVNAGQHGQSIGQAAIVRTAAHELTHYIQDYAPEHYDELQSFLLDHLIEWKGKSLGDLAAAKIQRDRTGTLTMEQALDEVVADGCEMMLRRTKVMQTMAQENRGLFRIVKDWIQKWTKTIRDAFRGVSEVHEEARAVAEMEAERLERFVELWDKGLLSAAERAQKSPAREGGAVKFSYSGERAQTADREKLHTAQQMEKQGLDTEQIRRETGWFRGMDGKWRFEIDDSGMQIFPGGDAQFAKDHPEYSDYKSLLNKAILGTITDEELARVKELEQTWGRELPRLSQRVKAGYATLGHILQHDALYEAYPELRDMIIRFGGLEAGTYGQYSRKNNTITLSENLRSSGNGTLLHEIQHAIQNIEGFASGASKGYWEDRLRNGYAEERRSKEYKDADKKYRDLFDHAPEGLKKKIRELNQAKIAGDVDAWDRIENELYDGQYSDYFIELDNADWERQRIFLSEKDYLATDLYSDTAGEIEARDTARRAKLTAEERKNTRPDVDQEGVVFAEGSDVQLDSDVDHEILQVKKQLKANNNKIMSLPIIAKIQSPTAFAKRISDRTKWAFEQLRKKGTIVDRNNFGKIKLDRPQIQKGMTYARTEGDKAAFLAIHDVLKRGIEIEYHPQHKGGSASTTQDVESWTIAGHVQINGVEGIMAVIVQKTKGLNYKAHKVLMPDGSAFLLQEYKEKEESGPAQGAPASERLVEPTDSSVSIILQSSENSNTKFQERDELPDDRELLMTVEARGKNAEALTAYQKKVQALEALQRKLGRQREALAAAKEERIATGASALAMTERESRKELLEKIQKTEASILRAEKVLDEMERDPRLRQEAERALAEWRDANPNEAARALREMRREQETLRRYVELLREEAKLTTPETVTLLPSDVNKLARALLKQYGSDAAVEGIAEKLQKLGDFMASNLYGADTGFYVQMQKQARQIAEEIVRNSYEEIDDNREIREGIRGYLRGHTLQISDSLRGDIPDFDRWRKAHMGTFRLGNEGMSIDQAYQDLRAEFGEELFPSDVYAESDQIQQILDTLRAVQPVYKPTFGQFQSWRAEEAVANEIMDRLMSGEVRERETMADRAYQERMRELERKYEKKDKARQQALENAEDRAVWEARKRDEAEERRREERALRRQLVQEKVHELRERSIQRDKEYKKRISIEKKTAALSKIMLENSGKRHVPDAWKEAIGNFLASIDTLTPQSGEKSRAFHLERIEGLQKMVQRQIAANQGLEAIGEKESGPQIFLDMNPYLAEMLDPYVRMAREADTGRLTTARMDLEQLTGLEEVLTALREAVDKCDKMLAEAEKGETLSGTAGKTVAFLEPLGKGKTGGMVRRFLQFDNLTPVYFFRRFGEAGERIFRSMQQGWGTLAFHAKEIIDYSESTYSGKEARAWEKEVHTFKLVKRESDLSGRTSLTKAAAEGGPEAVRKAEEKNRETVHMSTAQIMGLYCLVKREQARGHILGGGIRIWDIEAKKGIQEQAERYLVTAEDIAEICGTLTARQKEVADKLQKYMNTVGSAWGNQVSRARFGVDLFTEENYYPIQTDPQSRNARSPEADGADLFHILNMGFTKNTVKNAKNGIVLHSVFDVFANHMADMAKYNAMGLPMLDAMKWFNYRDETDGKFTSVRKAMETAYGKNAEKYFLGFIQDLNGSFEGGRRGEDVAQRMISMSKVASVGGNLRVAMLQPTSYVRALAVLDPKYLVAGDNPMKIKKGIEEAMQYSGTAVWKDLGFFDMNINANMRDLIKHTSGTVEKIREATMRGAEMGDKTTWGRLWNATKAETRAKTGLSGEELLKATAERFDDVIYRTQVMDSTMTRSHLMRQKGVYAGMVTSFMSEPTLSYNLVLDAVNEFSRDLRTMGRGAAWRKAAPVMARAFTVYALSQIAASLVESIFDALRDDDDYEDLWEKWKQAEFGWDGNLAQDLALHNKLPYIRDLVSIAEGYTNKRMDTEWVDYLLRAGKAVNKALQKGEDGKIQGFTWGTAYTVLRALSTMTGLPASNIARDSIALWNGLVVQFVPDWKLKTVKTSPVKPEAGVKQAYLAGALSEEDAVRYLMRDAEVESEERARQLLYEWGLEKGEKKYDALLAAAKAGDSEAFQSSWDELAGYGYSEKSLHSAVKSAVKEWYQGTGDDGGQRMSKQAAIEALVQFAGMRRREAEQTVQEWTSYVSSPEKLQYDEIKDAYLSGEITRERAEEMRALFGNKDENEAADEVNKWRCERETGIPYSEAKAAYLDGEIDRTEAVRIRMEYGGQSREDAEGEINKWSCEKETGVVYDEIRDLYVRKELTASQVRSMLITYGGYSEDEAEGKLLQFDYVGTSAALDGASVAEATRYYTDLSGLGIDKELWHSTWKTCNNMSADKNENGKTVTDSKLHKVAGYIDGLNLTPAQKDALFLQFYAEKQLRKTPWHN